MGTGTIDIFPLITDTVENVYQQRLKDHEQKAKVVDALMAWLKEARKKDVPDLIEKMLNMEQRTKKLVEDMTIEIEKDKPVVKTAGSDEVTWKMFQFGTNWFEPNPDLIETVLSGLFNDE